MDWFRFCFWCEKAARRNSFWEWRKKSVFAFLTLRKRVNLSCYKSMPILWRRKKNGLHVLSELGWNVSIFCRPKCKNLFSPYRKCKAIALNSQRNCLGASFSLALFKITVYGNKKHKTWDESSSARLSQLQIDLATQAYTIFDGNYFGRKKKYKIKQFMHFLPIRRWTRKFRNVKKLFPFCCVASLFAQVWANRKKNS